MLDIKRNFQLQHDAAALILQGEDLKLKSVKLNGEVLPTSAYQIEPDRLIIPNVPDGFILETEVEIQPQENTRFSGFYKSRTNFCTQCESQGFRRITYFFDRPDVMSRFTTTITDKKRYPVLLSNGNLMREKDLSDGRHWVNGKILH